MRNICTLAVFSILALWASAGCYGESSVDDISEPVTEGASTLTEGGQAASSQEPQDTKERHWSDDPELAYFAEDWELEPATHVNALHRVYFYGEEEGVAAGWNLDGEVTASTDEVCDGDSDSALLQDGQYAREEACVDGCLESEGLESCVAECMEGEGFSAGCAARLGALAASCGHGDFMSPWGDDGVDNQMAMVWAMAEELVGEAVVALLQDGINEGRMLVMLELGGVDDLVNDDEVTVSLYRSTDVPIVNVAGYLVPDQTFVPDPEFPDIRFDNASIVDGHVKAGPFNLAFPIRAFNADFLVSLDEGYVEFDINAEGRFSGHMGGIMDVHDIMGLMLQTNAAQEAALLYPIVEDLADINRTEEGCTHLSAALRFEGVTAFRVTEREE